MRKVYKAVLFLVVLFMVLAPVFASEMPDWVQQGYIEDDDNYVYSVGSGKAKTQQSSLLIAEGMATSNMNRMVNAMVTSNIQFYLNDSGIAESDDPADAAAYYSLQVISDTFAKNELKGIRRLKWYKDEDGYYWVLMRMPKSNIEKAFDSVAEAVVKDNGNAAVANDKREQAISTLRERVKQATSSDNIYDYQQQGM